MPSWRRGLASAPIRSANGANASSPSDRGALRRDANRQRSRTRRSELHQDTRSQAQSRDPLERARHRQRDRDGKQHRPSLLLPAVRSANLTAPARLLTSESFNRMRRALMVIPSLPFPSALVRACRVCRLSSISISSSTTTPLISISRSGLGSPVVRVGIFTSRPPMPPEPGRTFLRSHHSTRYPSWLFRFHRRPRQKNRSLHP